VEALLGYLMIAEKKQGRGGPAWLSGIWVFYLLNLVLQVLYDLIFYALSQVGS
jgi:hypothetical protein